MAETFLFQKKVLSGYHEYLASISVNAFGDSVEIEFDEDFIIDQISVESVNEWFVQNKYPSSGITSPAIMSQSGNASLNPYPSRDGRMWYRVPAFTKVILVVTSASPTTEDLNITILGRG